jgi:hypothetical protein
MDALPKDRLLVAVVRREERAAAREAVNKGGFVEMDSLLAVTRPTLAKNADVLTEAIRHDRMMAQLCERCSAVVPFRLGVRISSTDALRRVLRDHLSIFDNALTRFAGRFEMGIKIKNKSTGDLALEPKEHLGAIHELTRDARDRRERVVTRGGAPIFEGAYLIERAKVNEFWSAMDTLRTTFVGSPVLGTGPWAPYSFCDFEIEWTDSTSYRES